MISAPGDYGKPRPAVVVQSDRIALDSVLVAQVTSTIVDAPLYRLTIEPSERTGLERTSQVMVDKIITMRREQVRPGERPDRRCGARGSQSDAVDSAGPRRLKAARCSPPLRS